MALSKIQSGEMLDTPNLGRRNLMINGSHRIAQRGIAAVTASTSANYNSVDRWKSDIDGSSGHTWSHGQSTDAPVGFSHSSKITVVSNGAQPTGTSTNHQFYSMLEKREVEHLEWGTSNARTVTFSFYVKSSVAGKYGIRFNHYGSSSTYSYNTHYTINSADTWERKTITITGPTTGGITATHNDTAWLVEFKLGNDTDAIGVSGYQEWSTTAGTATESGTVYLPATSGATWYVTGCQLEIGSTATDFEYMSVAEELQLCQRYYQRLQRQETNGSDSNNVSERHVANTYITMGHSHSTTVVYAFYKLKTTMRDTPTLDYSDVGDIYANDGGANRQASALSIVNHPSLDGLLLSLTTSGLTAGEAVRLFLQATGDWIEFDSEL